ncbi:hypothetical protein [Acidocella sp.]|nr:hypothetical protein [Acidocella sp.]
MARMIPPWAAITGIKGRGESLSFGVSGAVILPLCESPAKEAEAAT